MTTRQRTIKGPVIIEGIGLQTGKKTRLVLKPSPADSGINFIRTDLPNKPLLNIQSVDLKDSARAPRRTALGSGPARVHTIEHLMAALSGLSIDNIAIELDNMELPGLDGSARGFVDAIRKSGINEQESPKKIFRVEEPVRIENEDRFIAILPDDDFRISYTLVYKNACLGTQYFDIAVDEENFENQIAPARTFCLKSEALMLAASGLGKGASWKNTLIMGRRGPFRNRLRFADEPVRHKVLDLMGDLYLLGMPIKGHVIAVKSGHSLNMELVRKLKAKG